MATGGLYSSTPTGTVAPQAGSESVGLYGNNTVFGGTYFEWFIFKESATLPATPTGGSWSFVTNTGTAPAGWTLQPPSAPVNQVYVSIALVNSKSGSALTWSVPGLFGVVPNFTFPTPVTGAPGTNASVVNTGTAANPILTFTIPRGDTGATGSAATIAAGTTTTSAPGTSASVSNSGTSSAAIFDFTIPRGAGVNSGGTTGQVLTKATNTDYDTTWTTITGALNYQGTWNASTNTPTLTSSVGVNGVYYVVSTAGSTNLNGVTDWNIGDWAIFNGSAWQKIDNTDLVTSVNGLTGTVVLTAANVGAVGTIASADGSIIVTTVGAAVDLSVSQTSPASVLVEQVRNTTGATLTKGTAVYISGATGQIPTVSKALATSDATSAQTLGLITTDLANNSNGFVTITGLVSNINTSAYTDGAQLYLSPITAGTLTATKPYAPQHLVYMAIVARAHPTQGKLIVSVQNGYELDELHNVSAQSPSNGQTIVYNSSTSLWEKSFAPILSSATGLPLSTGVTGTLPIANGGTGQTTATTAFNALAPSQATNSGKYLTTDGTNSSWATVVSGASISNDTTTATNLYPIFASVTTGVPTTVYTGNTKLLYKPSTGELQSTAMVSSNGITVNANTVAENYTIAATNNGMSAGPITINSGITVTVSSGSTWVVV